MSQQLSQFKEQAFASHVNELAELLTEFSGILDQEAQSIKQNDTDSLLKTNTQKQNLAEKLNASGNLVEQDLAAFDTNLIDFSMHEHFQSVSTECQEKVKQAINLTVECHDKNLANGMSIQILSNINQQALDILSGKTDADVKLYGSSGEKTQTGQQKTLGKA